VVFGAPWPLTMVGLDVTHQVNMLPEHLAQYSQIKNPMAQHVARIVPFYHQFFEASTPGLRGIYVHDSSAIAYLIDPTLFTVKRWPVRVETMGISRGKTWPATNHRETSAHFVPWQNRPLVNICVEVDSARLLAMELDRMT
jgi:inosine-uridine nucleoside N-ribohydrolase